MATISQHDSVSVDSSAAGLRFAVDVNTHFTDKVKPGDPRYWKLNMTFSSYQATAAELLLSLIHI